MYTLYIHIYYIYKYIYVYNIYRPSHILISTIRTSRILKIERHLIILYVYWRTLICIYIYIYYFLFLVIIVSFESVCLYVKWQWEFFATKLRFTITCWRSFANSVVTDRSCSVINSVFKKASMLPKIRIRDNETDIFHSVSYLVYSHWLRNETFILLFWLESEVYAYIHIYILHYTR